MSFALFLLHELLAFLDYNALVATVYADALQVVGWCVGCTCVADGRDACRRFDCQLTFRLVNID